MSETLKQLGEEELLTRISHYLPPGQIDDDTALIPSQKKDLLINTDVLVEGIHFDQKTTAPEDIGWRAVAANVSDLSASGVGKVIGLTIGLVTPPETEWQWIAEVYEGITNALKIYGGTILGGDCCNGKQKVISITAIGTLGRLRIHRSHAKNGDYLVVSGPHGLSRLGLSLLLNDPIIKNYNINKLLKKQAINSHKRPKPSIETIRKLEECKPDETPWRAAGADSSDGLIQAIKCICKSSKCSAVINKDSLPKPIFWPSGNMWDEWCINGGEDFELILSLPPLWAEAFTKVVPDSKIIGKITCGKSKVFWSDGSGEITSESMYTHF